MHDPQSPTRPTLPPLAASPPTSAANGPPRPRDDALWAALEALRIKHWVKNGLVFAPLLFAARIGDRHAWKLAILAALAFCLVASGIYVINDLLDRHSDRHHPSKRYRPIAAGRLSVPAAVVEALVVLLLGLGVAASLGGMFLSVILAYMALQLAYNAELKHRMLLDAICLACGFVLRAVGGAAAIHVVASPWLMICTFALCLFLGFCKRHCELHAMSGIAAQQHRATLDRYTPALLNHLITLSAGLAIITFLLYATSPRTVQSFNNDFFVYTIPLVFYGICRIAMLSMRGAYESPTELMLRDAPIRVTAALWLLLAVLIVMRGDAFKQWLLEHAMRPAAAERMR